MLFSTSSAPPANTRCAAQKLREASKMMLQPSHVRLHKVEDTKGHQRNFSAPYPQANGHHAPRMAHSYSSGKTLTKIFLHMKMTCKILRFWLLFRLSLIPRCQCSQTIGKHLPLWPRAEGHSQLCRAHASFLASFPSFLGPVCEFQYGK